jgi:hypothetical protein
VLGSTVSTTGKVGDGSVKVRRRSDKLEAYLSERRPSCVVKALAEATTPRGSFAYSVSPPPPHTSSQSVLMSASMSASMPGSLLSSSMMSQAPSLQESQLHTLQSRHSITFTADELYALTDSSSGLRSIREALTITNSSSFHSLSSLLLHLPTTHARTNKRSKKDAWMNIFSQLCGLKASDVFGNRLDMEQVCSIDTLAHTHTYTHTHTYQISLSYTRKYNIT